MQECPFCATGHKREVGMMPPDTPERRMARAIKEIRELIWPWGEGEHAVMIRAILDRNGV